jgi:hypothetical protein
MLRISIVLHLVLAAQQPLEWPQINTNKFNVQSGSDTGVKPIDLINKQKSGLTGDFTSCFLSVITVGDQDFIVRLDTGSSDTIIPHTSLNNYSGASFSYSIPSGQEQQYGNEYFDGSFWNGYLARVGVTLKNTTISTSSAPIFLMTNQSTEPLFVNGNPVNGLMGVAYPDIAIPNSDPKTLMDAWVTSNSVSKNQIAIHGCKSTSQANGWIDFGNDTPYSGCGMSPVTVGSPSHRLYTVDLKEIAIGSEYRSSFNSQWQTQTYSFVDSCTSVVILPVPEFSALVNKILAVGVFASSVNISQTTIQNWLIGNLLVNVQESDFVWDNFPDVKFTVASNSKGYQNVSLTLKGRDYVQKDRDGYYAFLIAGIPTTYAVLGLPIFSTFHVVLDRALNTISFQPGCGCESSSTSMAAIKQDEMAPCSCLSYVPMTATTTSKPCSCSTQISGSSSNPRIPLLAVLLFALL